jgi:DNA-binding NarL/FixJ family response regulator
MVAQSLGRMLESEDDIEVIATASSVADGLAAAAQLPDVMLIAYRLPDGDGVSAAALIKSAYPSIRIVLLTGSDEPCALRRAVDAGCLGYVDKARSIGDLADAVRIAATGHVVISATDLSAIATSTRRDIASLTRREREILYLISDGLSNKSIAERLILSVHTVRTHVQTILAKLDAHSKLEALAVAKRRRLVG